MAWNSHTDPCWATLDRPEGLVKHMVNQRDTAGQESLNITILSLYLRRVRVGFQAFMSQPVKFLSHPGQGHPQCSRERDFCCSCSEQQMWRLRHLTSRQVVSTLRLVADCLRENAQRP